MSAKQENRYRRMALSEGRIRDDRRQEIEATMPSSRDSQLLCEARSREERSVATRAEVRRWMREYADRYETAVGLAEAAGVAFRLPGSGLADDEHWVWVEALVAVHGE